MIAKSLLRKFLHVTLNIRKRSVINLIFWWCRFADHIGVQEEAIALIACLATDVELVLHQVAVEGIHSMILNAMNNFPDQMSLAEISLEALGEYLYISLVFTWCLGGWEWEGWRLKFLKEKKLIMTQGDDATFSNPPWNNVKKNAV